MSAVLMYATTPSREEALRIGRSLVENRLAACINVLDGMESVYWWEGRVEKARECVLIVKTREDQAAEAASRVRSLHPYACPCLVYWPITGGNADFLAWIERESDPALRSDEIPFSEPEAGDQ